MPLPASLLGQMIRPDVVTTPITGLLDALASIVGTAGVGVMVWGAYGALTRLIGAETAQARGQKVASVPRSQYRPYLIMGMEFCSFLYKLSINRVLYFSFYSNSDGLCHFITGNNTCFCFTQISFNHCFSFLLLLTAVCFIPGQVKTEIARLF